MQAADISHYYSSSSEEEPLTQSIARKQNQAVETIANPSMKEVAADLASGDIDIAVTKEMRNTSRKMKKMAQSAKRWLGLRSTTA